jgi:hypothetical protein
VTGRVPVARRRAATLDASLLLIGQAKGGVVVKVDLPPVGRIARGSGARLAKQNALRVLLVNQADGRELCRHQPGRHIQGHVEPHFGDTRGDDGRR